MQTNDVRVKVQHSLHSRLEHAELGNVNTNGKNSMLVTAVCKNSMLVTAVFNCNVRIELETLKL